MRRRNIDAGIPPSDLHINQKEIQIISELDPSYIEDRQIKKESAMRDNRVLGNGVFNEAGGVNDEQLRRLIYDLENIAARGGQIGRQEIRSLFIEALTDRAIINNPVILEITRNMPGHPNAPILLLEALENQALPHDVIATIFKRHQEIFRQKSKEGEAKMPERFADFRKKFQRLLDDKAHPLSLDMFPDGEEYVNRRLSEPAVVIADPLVLVKDREKIGDYNLQANVARLLYDRPSTTSRAWDYSGEIFNHEMVHVLAGRVIGKTRANTFVYYKQGLNLLADFDSLDEAVTEQIAQDMDHPSNRRYNVGSYTSERQIFARLLQYVPEELFLRAYFENSDKSETAHGVATPKTEARDELVDRIEQSFGKHFLSHVSHTIRMEGAESVAASVDLFDNRE